MNIDKTKLSKEVKDKYQIHDNAFDLDVIKNPEKDRKGEVKDNVRAIIGDDKVPDTFIPQLKLSRWTNETNFSIRLKDTEKGEEQISTLKDKIKYSKGNIDIEFYDYTDGEGGYKLVWYLKEKPKTNKIEFTIQSKGLKFYYQPELTQKEKDEGMERPENVVGSYAVYHSTKGGLNDSEGKDYKVGKAFHIYRPRIIDAEGKETWGILNIENGIYSVEIPQEFLDKAVYPIRSNDTFGYDGSGTAGYFSIGGNTACGSLVNSTASSDGEIDSISVYGSTYEARLRLKGFITNDSLNIIENGVDGIVDPSDTDQWYDFEYSTKPNVLEGNNYHPWFVVGITYSFYLSCDSGSGDNSMRDYTNNYGTPTNPADSEGSATSTYKFSIYATYTPSATETEVNSERGIELTGKASSTNDRSVELSGKVSIASERNIELSAISSLVNERSIEMEGQIVPVLSVEQVDNKIRLTWLG